VGIRPEFRWWVLTVLVVLVLLLLSALALDRPNVVWSRGVPYCPQCRSEVPLQSTRCPTCREQYDWTVAPDEESPLSPWSLSPLEAEVLRQRVTALGAEEAARRVSEVLDIAPAAATSYLAQVGRGRCGWCGGTGLDLARDAEHGTPCPACLGKGQCVACGGDRRIRVGDDRARQDFEQYWTGIVDIPPILPVDAQKAEARRLAETFLRSHAGTIQATRVLFWPEWHMPPTRPALDAKVLDLPGYGPRVVEACRRRLDLVLKTLGAE
jgi:hypothetical protein